MSTPATPQTPPQRIRQEVASSPGENVRADSVQQVSQQPPFMKQAVLVLLLCIIHATAAAIPSRSWAPDAASGVLVVADKGPRQQAQITSQEAAAIVRDRTGGRVLAVQRASAGGRAAYRVKVLTGEGEIRVYQVDAVTGAMR